MTLLAVLVFTLGPQAEPAPQPRIEAASRMAIRPAPVWDRLAECESDGRWDYNGLSGFDGGLQFHPGTWSAYRSPSDPAYAWQASRARQIAVAERVLEAQGWAAWPSCARQLGLR